MTTAATILGYVVLGTCLMTLAAIFWWLFKPSPRGARKGVRR